MSVGRYDASGGRHRQGLVDGFSSVAPERLEVVVLVPAGGRERPRPANLQVSTA